MIDAVIFDVDGTLWNTTGLVADAWNAAIKEYGMQNREPITGEILRREFGRPMNVIMDHLFPGQTEEEKVKLLTLCCEYEHDSLIRTKEDLLYPNVVDVFETLSKTHKICVVSNCQSGYIELFLEKHGLQKYVTDTECYGDTLLSKGENIKLVIERNKLVNPIYVGDTMGDFEATKIAQIPFVFVTYGFGQVEGAWKEIGDLKELLDMV